jgi:hypothetical protein
MSDAVSVAHQPDDVAYVDREVNVRNRADDPERDGNAKQL